MQPRHLFENTVFVERTLSSGTTLRLKLEPLAREKVCILEYWRKPKGTTAFKRVKEQEGQTLSFEKLNLGQSFQEVFGLARAA